MMLRIAAALVALCCCLSMATAATRTSVAVAPFATASADEYHWIGTAMAIALAMRIHQQHELNGLAVRQVKAAMRHDNLDKSAVATTAGATKLGRLLGADLILVGSYEARWPDIEFALQVVAPKEKKLRRTHTVRGALDRLVDVEASVAAILASELGANKPAVTPAAHGTTSLKAWQHTTQAHELLAWQSLGPRAADPSAPLSLPANALGTAKDHLEQAIELDAKYGEAWATLGVTQALLGQTAKAWKSFGKATSLGFGHHPTAVLGSSFVRMRQGRWDEAADILKSAIAKHPGFLHARGYLGELYNHIRRHKEALAVFEAYAQTAPEQPWVLAQRGYTKSKLGNHAGAIADTIDAVDLLPESPSLLLQLASRYIDAGKYIGAEDALRHALKLFPDEARVYVRLGYVYLLQGRDELAIPISEKALLLAKMDTQRRDRAYAHLNLARALGHQGELDQAFVHLAKAKNNGLSSLSEVDKDARLAKLRADPRYAKLN